MSFKFFIIASLTIHIVGLTSLYFYYNPIILSPEPVEFFEEENRPTKQVKKLKDTLSISKTKKSVLRRKQKEKKQNILPKKQGLTAQPEQKSLRTGESQSHPANLAFKSEDLFISTQKEALSEAKDPLPKMQKPSIETADSPIELHLEEIKEEDSLASKLVQTPSQNLEDFEEVISDSPSSEQPQPATKLAPSDSMPIMSDSVKETKVSSQNLEDFEEVSSDSPSFEQPQPATKLAPSDSMPIMSDSVKETKVSSQNLEDFEEVNSDSPSFEQPQPAAKRTQEASRPTREGSMQINADFKKAEVAPQDESNVEGQANTHSVQTTEENSVPKVETLGTEENLHERTNAEPKSLSSTNSIKTFQSLKQKMGNPSLFYPDFARKAGMQGTVSILFFVTQQGLVDKIQLESSSGHSELDNFVIRTLARYEFLPGQESWVRHQVPFVLEGEEIERLLLRREKAEE